MQSAAPTASEFALAPARLRHQLLERIHRRFQTRVMPLQVGELRLHFTRIADPDRVLDEVARDVDLQSRLGRPPADDAMHLPYWAELWDSSIGIAQWLANDANAAAMAACARSVGADAGAAASGRVPLPLAGASILDLGCGMGMAGMVAAALGASVLFADLERPALLFARLNSLPWRCRVRTRQLNWKRDRLNERFDVILGADIVYERAQWESLEPFWQAHLAAGGHVLLGEPGRQTGQQFPAWASERGWQIQRHTQSVSTRSTPIQLMVAQRGV